MTEHELRPAEPPPEPSDDADINQRLIIAVIVGVLLVGFMFVEVGIAVAAIVAFLLVEAVGLRYVIDRHGESFNEEDARWWAGIATGVSAPPVIIIGISKFGFIIGRLTMVFALIKSWSQLTRLLMIYAERQQHDQ